MQKCEGFLFTHNKKITLLPPPMRLFLKKHFYQNLTKQSVEAGEVLFIILSKYLLACIKRLKCGSIENIEKLNLFLCFVIYIKIFIKFAKIPRPMIKTFNVHPLLLPMPVVGLSNNWGFFFLCK